MLERPSGKRLKILAVSIFLVGLVLGAGVTYAVVPRFSFTTILEEGTLANGYSFLVFKDGVTYCARNGTTGAIPVTSANASYTINYAINQCGSSGNVVLGNGTFFLSAPIIVDSGITLEGQSFPSLGYSYSDYGTVLYVDNNAQCNAIERSKVSTYKDIAIKNLMIDGNKANNPDNSVDGDETGIFLGATQGWLIENVKVVNTRREGIYIASSSYGRMETVTVSGSERGGIILDAAVYNDLINVVAYGNSASGGSMGCGLEISTDSNMKFAVNVFGGRFFDNQFGIAVRNYGGTASYSQMVSIFGVAAFQNTYDGIWLKQAGVITVDGCFSYFNNRTGTLVDGSSNITISSSHMYDNDYFDGESTYGNGVSVQDSNFTMIIGSFMGNNYGATQNYGFREHGAADYNCILGCVIRGNANPTGYDIIGANTHINATWAASTWLP